MKRLLTALFLAIIIFLNYSCKMNNQPTSSNSGNNNSGGDIFPLKVGNYWTFKLSIKDGTTGEIIPMKDYYTIIVLGDTIIDGETFYKLKNPLDKKEYSLLINKNGNIFELDDSLYVDFKYPAALNEQYVANYDTVKILSVSQKIIVPYGTFNNCYVYNIKNYTNDGTVLNFYLYPSVGIVNIELFSDHLEDDNNISHKGVGLMELKDYHLN